MAKKGLVGYDTEDSDLSALLVAKRQMVRAQIRCSGYQNTSGLGGGGERDKTVAREENGSMDARSQSSDKIKYGVLGTRTP